MRLRCPRCSAIVEGEPGTQIVCSQCGFTAMAPGGPTPQQAPAAPQGYLAAGATSTPALTPPGQPFAGTQVLNPNHGPLGKRRWPGTPILLGIVTLGIYILVWEWKISKEMDAFMQRPDHAHKRVKTGIFLSLGAAAAIMVGLIALIASLGPAIIEDPETVEPDAAMAGGLLIFVLLVLVAIGLGLAGAILVVMGLWRVWKMIEEDDRRRLVNDPFNATTLLVFYLLQLVPYVGFIFGFIALAMTQNGLNKVWNAYSPSAVGAAPM